MLYWLAPQTAMSGFHPSAPICLKQRRRLLWVMLRSFFNEINESAHPQIAEGIAATAKTGSQGQRGDSASEFIGTSVETGQAQGSRQVGALRDQSGIRPAPPLTGCCSRRVWERQNVRVALSFQIPINKGQAMSTERELIPTPVD